MAWAHQLRAARGQEDAPGACSECLCFYLDALEERPQ
jgi:hypothetical protein